jgi:uncharacterized protein YqfB (UPF0267 family)
MNPSDIARQLGRLGGLATKQQHPADHYEVIGRKGAATRWYSAMVRGDRQKGGIIYFKTPLYDLVEQGAKTTTLRKWTNVKPEQQVFLACGRRSCQAVIEQVEQVTLDEFDDALVKSEGFATKDELVRTLDTFYPGQTRFFLIRFHTL